jgi:hypothetical protein
VEKVNFGGEKMEWQPPEGMDEYLKPTQICDCDNQEIGGKAKEIIADAKTPSEAAIKIFYFVRDQILFALDYGFRASETLKRGTGQCVTKTNLQIALLRAARIPARYHQVVLTKNCLKGIIADLAFKFSPERILWHPWCECYLTDKWISCDTLFDKGLYEAACKKGIISKEQIPTIDWDGENDLNTMTAWILEDVGTLYSFDDVLTKAQKAVPPKIIAQSMFGISNRHTNKVRKS